MGTIIDKYIGSRVRKRRLLVGLSQDALGKLSCVSFQQIQKYEKAIDRIPASRLWLIAGALEVEPGYFYQGLKEYLVENEYYEFLPANCEEQYAINYVGFHEEAEPFKPEPFLIEENEKESAKILRAYYRIPNKHTRKTALGMVEVLGDAPKNKDE